MEPLPYWEPCNPGCDPEFNGSRSRYCAQLCHNAREALAAAPAQGQQVECDDDLLLELDDLRERLETARHNWRAFEDRCGDLQVENGKLRDELAALKAQQTGREPVEGIHRDPYPAKCPITGLPYFMHLEHPEDGVIPTFGGPYDSYSIPHAEGSPDELWHKRELVSHRYCHDRGHWVDDEFIPLRIIHEDVLSELQDGTTPQPAPAQDVVGLALSSEHVRHIVRVLRMTRADLGALLSVGEKEAIAATLAAHDKQSGGE